MSEQNLRIMNILTATALGLITPTEAKALLDAQAMANLPMLLREQAA